ncbi:UNVERIFIED_CONTAM: hypothetical protein K2H54_041829 [Gekko kuhli]
MKTLHEDANSLYICTQNCIRHVTLQRTWGRLLGQRLQPHLLTDTTGGSSDEGETAKLTLSGVSKAVMKLTVGRSSAQATVATPALCSGSVRRFGRQSPIAKPTEDALASPDRTRMRQNDPAAKATSHSSVLVEYKARRVARTVPLAPCACVSFLTLPTDIEPMEPKQKHAETVKEVPYCGTD